MNIKHSPNYQNEMNHRLIYLKRKIKWDYWQKESFDGQRVFKHEKLILSLLLLKKIFGFSSNYRLIEAWEKDYTWQYFAGIEFLAKPCPILTSDLSVAESYIGNDVIKRFVFNYIELEREEFSERLLAKKADKTENLVNDYLMHLNS